MTTIDELGSRAAATARADAAEVASARVDTGLARLRLEATPIATAKRRGIPPRRWLAMGVAATLAAATIVALAVNTNHSPNGRLVPSAPTTERTVPSTSVVTSVATSIPPGTTEAPPVVTSDAIAVAHGALPPAFPAKAFATVDAPADPTRLPLVAVGEGIVVTADSDTSTATVIDTVSGAPPRTVPLDVAPAGQIAAGPGDVLYAVVQGAVADMSIVAIALIGDRAGQVVASAPIAAVAFVEAPIAVLGHGQNGIIDRRTGQQLIGYVDVGGGPTTLGRPAHVVTIPSGDITSGDLVVDDPDGTHDWHLSITRESTSPSPPSIGETPPAASSHGGAVVWTAVGPPDDPTSDTPSPTEPVVAVLESDGTGTWYSLVDGWQVAASDLDGTVLTRRAGNSVELAHLDPAQRFDFLDQPKAPHQRMEYAATLPTTLATAEPCAITDLDVVPTADGAMGTVYGGLEVRNTADRPCQVSGVPDVAFLDDKGNVVQSTDPAQITGTSGAQPIVLERDSWARAELGAIASNVCGGNQSSQFRMTIGAKSTVVPFVVGRPFDPTGCDTSYNQQPVPGALAAAPFAEIQTDLHAVANPFDNLEITLDAPATVQAGETLRYDVVVTVPANDRDSQLVADATCPIYTETLGTATGQFLLNCNGIWGVLIAPGESVRFHIELNIPSDVVAGPATLSWTPIEPAGHQATATITILP